jgi:hypothetical protein
MFLERVSVRPHPSVAFLPSPPIDPKLDKGGSNIDPEELISIKEGMVKIEEDGPSVSHTPSQTHPLFPSLHRFRLLL